MTAYKLLIHNESMELTAEHKKAIERKIMETVIASLESGKLTPEEYDEVSVFILKEIEQVKTHDELLLFLRKLTHHWNVFAFILSIENGVVQHYEDKEKIEKVREMLQENSVNDAVPSEHAASHSS